jgi:hypothetical protein
MNPQFRSGSALMLLLGAVGCRGSAAEPDAFTVEAELVRSATPTGRRVGRVDEVVRESLRVSQEWGLALETDWPTFAAQAASSLSGRYRCTADAEKLSCARRVPGDAFSLSYAPSGKGQVRVRLEARPD